MTATQSGPDHRRSWPPGLPRSLDYPEVPVGSILRAAVRRWGDRPAFIDHDVAADLHRAGPRGRTPSPAGWPTTASAGATSSRCTSRTAASTRRSTTGSCWPAPPSPPPTRCCRRPTSPPSSPTPARRVLVTWDQVLPFVRGALAQTPVRDRRRHRRGAHPRLRRPARPLEDGDVDLADLLGGDPDRPAPRRRPRPGRRPRPPGLHRRHDRRQQGRGAAAPQRRHQRAAVGLLDLGLAARSWTRPAT